MGGLVGGKVNCPGGRVVLLSILAATSSIRRAIPLPPALPPPCRFCCPQECTACTLPQLYCALTALYCPAEKDKFVELFYNRYISHLLAALVAAGDAAAAPPASSNGGVPAGPAGAGAAAGAAGAAAPAKPAATGPAPKPGAACGPGQPPPSAATVGLVVDLLCFCVVSHSYRIKYYILRNNVVEKVRRP